MVARLSAAPTTHRPASPRTGRFPRSRSGWIDAGLRVAAVALLIQQFAAQSLLQHPSLLQPTLIGSDPANYYAAGQRLNLGHALYGPLQPGDIPTPDYPAIYPAPLLSPPLIAVLWRPLALLPFDVATTAWWLVGILLVVGLVLWCAARGGRTELVILVAVLLLGLPIAGLRKASYPYPGFDAPVAIGALSGNVNAYLAALFAVVWWSTSRVRGPGSPGSVESSPGQTQQIVVGLSSGDHETRAARNDSLAGSAVAVAAALKVTPLAGFVWLAAQDRRAAVGWGVIALSVLALLGLVGAGLSANVDYVGVALSGRVSPTLLSLPGIATTWLHLSPKGPIHLLPFAAIPIGVGGTWLLRHHPRASLAAAILTAIWGSPVVYPGNFVLLLAVATPSP